MRFILLCYIRGLQRIHGIHILQSRGWFNIRMSNQYMKSDFGDKKILWSTYLQNRILYTDKKARLYWTSAQMCSTGTDWPIISEISNPEGYGLNRLIPSYKKTYWSATYVLIFWDLFHVYCVSWSPVLIKIPLAESWLWYKMYHTNLQNLLNKRDMNVRYTTV